MKTRITMAIGLLAVSGVASADWSANIGFQSDYYFRGIFQKSASAQGGLDYEHDSGFYVGTWVADVGGDIAGDGLEVDLYGGWGGSSGDFSYGIGFTGYYYTGEFDDTYEEINLNLGYGIASLEYSVGEWDGFGDDADYDFIALTLESESGFYGTYGSFGKDFDGDYIELGWGTTISDIDIGIAAILSSDELSDELDSDGDPEESEAIVFSISKSF